MINKQQRMFTPAGRRLLVNTVCKQGSARAFVRASAASPATMPSVQDVASFIDSMNTAYEKVHKEYEDNFWSTKMALKGASTEALSKTKSAYEAFLGNPENLAAVRAQLQTPGLSEEQKGVLAIMEKTFKCYITEDPQAKDIKEQLNTLEAELSAARNTMALGYKDPHADGAFVKASSVQLRDRMRVSDEEPMRQACWEGLRSIGPFVSERFLSIVKLRNKLARKLGYVDFYDMKVNQAEGFGKDRLFTILDDLERRSRPILTAARERLAQEKGASALQPWNTGYALAGDTEKAMDPYFPFEDAVDVWARTFAALGIQYKDSTMALDLCDREGKYSNGFCHWPQPAWKKPDGSWVPAKTNFTSLATPSQIGSGKTALVTLLHEGGHAAHFANILQASPFFSQERAPTSVAYAENQSMFLDAFAGDAAWLARYARSRDGQPIPWEVIEAHKKATHPYSVFALRGMLAVSYFEKELYELPEDELTVDKLIALADRIENEIQGGLAARPLLSVPHILADEASCYYHGYTLAEMSVHQTRAYFNDKYKGKLVDNPEIGRALSEVYWRPGNSAAFLDLVQQLTGKPLTADAWVHELQTPLDKLLAEEKVEYDAAVAAGPAIPPGSEPDLGMRVLLVHGDHVISDSAESGGLSGAVAKFKKWVRETYFGGK